MQHKYSLFELNGVNGAVRSTHVVFDNLQDSGATKTFQRLGGIMLFPVLSEIQSVTEEPPYAGREVH